MNKLFNKLKCLVITILILNFNCLAAKTLSSGELTVSHERLKKCVNLIQQLPSGKNLISQVLSEGDVHICLWNTPLSQSFGAFWDPSERVIAIAMSRGVTDGSIIGSMLFELHNAKANTKIEHFYRLARARKIDKASYVEEMERMEYQNSIEASRIANEGIKKGLFPSDAFLPTYHSFEEHFRVQKKSGHSAHFSHSYDRM